MKNLETTLSIARAIVLQATYAVQKIYNANHHDNLEVSFKQDNTPVTNADLLSNTIIVEGLRQNFPEIPIISEEEPIVAFKERRAWRKYWLTDPLDGTAQFINRTDEFSINLALIINGTPVIGIVSAPAKSLIYYAIKGAPAYKEYFGQQPEIIQAQAFNHDKSLKVIGGHSVTINKRILNLLHELKIKCELIKYGSSLKICRIAEGKAHLYPRLDKNCEWDTAAGHCILNAAGGQIIDLKKMSALRYNTKPSLSSEEFIACARNLEEIIEFLALNTNTVE